MLRLILAVACALSLAACNTTRIDASLASADQKLRDKCAYLVSGVGIAEVASVHKLGSSGSRASDWLGSAAAQWQNGFAALAPDAAIVVLGINDASWAVAPDLFGWQMASLVERCRTAIPAVDVMMATPPSTPLAYGSNIPLLASAASDVADRQGCAFVSLQPLFGNPSRPFDYAYSTGRAMFLSDDTHPTPEAAQSIAYEFASMMP